MIPDSVAYLYRVSSRLPFPTEVSYGQDSVQINAADSVFGSASEHVITLHNTDFISAADTLFGSVPFHVAVFVLFIAYLILIYHQSDKVGELMKCLFYSSDEALYEDHSEWRFGVQWRIMGLLSFMLGCYAMLFTWFAGIVTVDSGGALAAGCLAVVAVWILQIVILRVSGAVVMQNGVAQRIMMLKRYAFEVMGVCAAPVVMGYAVSSGVTQQFLLYLTVIEFVVILSTTAFKSLKLFVASKVSIFFWFLYLCGVEIFPLSLAIVIWFRVI